MRFLNKNKLNKILLLIFCIFCLTVPVFAQEDNPDTPPDNNINYVSGKILQIISEKGNKELEESFQTEQITQTAKVLVLSGKYKGKIVKIENQLTSNPVYDIKIKAGNRIILSVEENPKNTVFYIADLERVPVLLILTGIFLLLLMLIGGMQGLRSIVSILVTAVLVFFVLVPAVLSNFPIIPMTVFIAIISTFATMFIVSGINLKSFSASMGTILSVIIAGLMSSLVIKFAPLNGFGSQESVMLWANRPDLDYTGLLTAGMIIASLGAVMDVGMSIASSIYEFKNVNSTLNTKDLFKSGLNVGKDIMGAMSNTLILAYIGGAFSLVLLASNAPLIKLLNLNSIAAEIASAITGSIGIVLCVPITALIAAYLIGNYTNKSQKPDNNP
ncbi:MAG TPA: YibE/F family protein [Cyanobacteria bacterium UBA9971]|nr:YibE/F family protein [Cyanobacteria bacterium UBA9971]